ncbi:programmed cell death 6-interacting protein-like isoform X1 [Mytilus trossulus]|uniref:programmed cell death 6-interacting protein-like isoform X1 n=1 Tax=Mytilus trossulus TaxID=6551 RepID=UPI0030062257
MATFLAVPLKQTQEVEFIKPMRSFIQNTFSQADPDDYNKALNEFSKLRNLMIAKSVDKHDSALEILYRYYDQVVAIENKLPIAENQIRVNFKWRDAFDKESLFSGKRILAIASGSYEKVCMLFNIAALQTQIAEVQNHDSDEGLKTSAKYFQSASGIFGHLKDVVLSHIQQDPTPDMNPDTLNALSALMVAQAQETIYRKCANDKMKDVMVAKVVHQCSELYADAMKLMQLSTLKELWPKEWIPSVVMKQAAFHAMAEFYQSCVCKEARSYGEQIARLQHANDLMAASSQRGGTTFNFRNEQGKIQRELQSAKKDNDFIYHDKVPDVKTLDPIGKAQIAKPSPLPSREFSDKFQDLFSKLVPIPVYDALNAFENRKNTIISGEIGRLREASTLMNSVLASLNLPAAIEDVSGSNKVPQSVLDKAKQVQDQGGMQHLDKLINDLPELLCRNREILDDCIKQLDDEEQSDKQLRDQFKERWSRTPSDKLTKPMKDECMKYKHILDTAIGADKVVQEKYAAHKSAIALLSKPFAEIEKGIPSAGSYGGLQNNSAVQQLKKMMEEVATIKAEREVIETEIKDVTFDMSSKFFSAMASDGLIDEESLSVGELDRMYGPLREQVNDSIQRQEMLMGRVQNTNTEFCQAKASNQGAAQREQVLKDLAAGFDMYMELKSNLEEGTKFYNDLTPLLVKLQNKISDFCFARKTEKDELMSDLQKRIASQPSGPAPKAPSYQSPPESTQSRVPPPRPPPPSYTSAPGPAPGYAPPGSNQPQANAPPPHEQQPAQQSYGQPGAWGQQSPYPLSMSMPAMPSGFNAYNPYMQPYPGQQQPPYPGQQPYGGQQPMQYPGQQPYPGQQQPYPGQQQPQYQNPPYPQQPQWR